jgi:hypothetical protein
MLIDNIITLYPKALLFLIIIAIIPSPLLGLFIYLVFLSLYFYISCLYKSLLSLVAFYSPRVKCRVFFVLFVAIYIELFAIILITSIVFIVVLYLAPDLHYLFNPNKLL